MILQITYQKDFLKKKYQDDLITYGVPRLFRKKCVKNEHHKYSGYDYVPHHLEIKYNDMKL